MSRAGHWQEMADMERRAPDIMRDREATLKRIEDLRTQQQNLVGNFGWVQMLAPTEEELGRMQKAADVQKQIEGLQHMLDAAEQATRRTDLRAGKEETDRLRARFFGSHEGMERAYSDAKKDVEKYQKELFEPEKPLTKTEVLDLSGKLRTAQAAEARWKGALDAEKNQSEQLKQFHSEAAAFVKKGEESELDAIGKIYYRRDILLKQAGQVKATESEIAAIRKSADEQASEILKKSEEEFEKYDEKRRADSQKEMMALFLPSKEQLKEWEDVFKAQERIEDIGVEMQRETLRRRSSLQAKAAETPEDAYRIRVDLAVQLAQIEVARIEREDNAARRMVLAAEAQKQLYTDLAQAQDELDEKRAEAERKHAEELQREVDEIQKTASGLLHTLFTKPADFPKQLGSTLREAALKPVTEGLGGMIASAIHPLIYGSDGQGGLAGIFHGAFGGGKQDPVTVTADNTTATRQNSSATLMLTSVLAGFMGIGAPAMATPMSIPGVTGISLPPISAPAMASRAASVAASLPGVWGGYSPAAVSSSGAAATTGGYTPAPWASSSAGGYSPAPWASNPLATILRGGAGPQTGTAGVNSLFSKGGFSQALSNLKGAVWNEDAWNAYPGTTGGVIAGGIEGVASSPAAGIAGLSLATRGLISNAGSWTGAIQGAAGGALIGNQIGGPLGAAAGASFGFEIGALEKLFGVKSLNQTAHDDIKSVYGVDIPTNSGTIKQVVDIAKQQFGGSISVAVRSPSVRQLVMLYSEATGQKMPLSATTPYAGSLVEQGGNLYQQASFQNNAWHMYQSSLPTLGAIPGSTYPTPGGPNTATGAGPLLMQVLVDGKGSGDYMAGNVFTPQFVTDQSLAAQDASYGRTQQSANMQLPGLTVA
jgi:hypothetical protein